MAQLTAWGIEIGSFAIKAIRLERNGDDVSVSDFSVIPHKRVLTTPDLDQDEVTRLALGQFISEKSLEGEHLVMSVPGHAAFARFAKLPPVEPKKVPDIVKFEAVQQIPFPIEEVEWDYETFTSDDSPETEVGIFAITRERVHSRLDLYSELGLSPESLTLSPVSVYNAMAYDLDLMTSGKPVMFLDIGTQATDVIIAEEGRCWIRTFPLGGTHFTEAIASAFKLTYSKAEKLKIEAATSKYAKQIMQAMRPVFSDLLQDLQRSIGYYASLHKESEIGSIVGIGSTFKIPGLRKFLGQQLQVDVHRLDEFKKIQVAGREAASFAEHTVNMATAYGLALQGVGMAQIDANLVPVNTLREQMWHQKTKWFAAAAAIVVAGAGIAVLKPVLESKSMAVSEPEQVASTVAIAKKWKSQFEELQASSDLGASAANMTQLLDYRRVWPQLTHDAAAALASTNPQEQLTSDEIEEAASVPASQRRLVRMQGLDGQYVYNPESKNRRIQVTLNVELSRDKPIEFLHNTVGSWLREMSDQDRADVPYRIIGDSITITPRTQTVWKVDADGNAVATGGAMTQGGNNPGAPLTGSSGASRPNPPAAGGQGPTLGEGGGSLGGGTSQKGARRQQSSGQVKSPGADLGGAQFGSGDSAGAASGGTTGQQKPKQGFKFSGDDRSGDSEAVLGDLDEVAPVPTRPSIYKAGDTFYRLPITFTIELIEPNKPATPMQADAGSAGSVL